MESGSGDTGAVEILSLQVLSKSDLASVDGGATWDQISEANVWTLTLEGKATVQSPMGPVQPGCLIRQVQGLTPEQARVLCRDGDITGTSDGGKTWIVRSDQLADVAAIAYLNPLRAYALAPAKRCDAAAYATLTGGVIWTRTACLEGQEPQALAVDQLGRLVAQVDGAVQVSTDGETWSAR